MISAVTAVVSGQQGDSRPVVWPAVTKYLKDSEGIVGKQRAFETRWQKLKSADPKLAALIPHTELKWDAKMVHQCRLTMLI